MSKQRSDAEIEEMVCTLEKLAADRSGLPIADRLSDQARILSIAHVDSHDRPSAALLAIELTGKTDEQHHDLIHALDWAAGKEASLITPDGLRLPRGKE